jgi:hypothetical protein
VLGSLARAIGYGLIEIGTTTGTALGSRHIHDVGSAVRTDIHTYTFLKGVAVALTIIDWISLQL